MNGQRVAIVVNGSQAKVGNANVIKTDIECSNGVIHVIDQVLIPGPAANQGAATRPISTQTTPTCPASGK